MSSVVYYKFKSQKEDSRVTFDGTGISVFDLKREILIANKLTTTAESFDLQVTNPDTKEEYKDDTEVIPRSSRVLARRMPSAYPGASRYVTGAAAVNKRRQNKPMKSTTADVAPVAGQAPAGSEEEQIQAMFMSQNEQWNQTQQHMSQQQFIVNRNNQGQAANVPDHPPPDSYVCYRCGQKGHWIQACPTNNDPNWEGKRVKRTTGIPKSMLQKVSKPADDDSNTYLVNEDGEYVRAMADDKSWQNYQNKTNAARVTESEVVSNPELICPLSHKLFVDPVKTPCCKKTYSRDAIENSLLESDFKCPNCSEEEVLLDQLTFDEETQAKLDALSSSDSGKRKRHDGEEEEGDVKKSKTGEADNEAKNDDDSDGYEPQEPQQSQQSQQPQDASAQMPMVPPFMMPPPPMMPPFMMPPFMPQFMNSQGGNNNGKYNNGNKRR